MPVLLLAIAPVSGMMAAFAVMPRLKHVRSKEAAMEVAAEPGPHLTLDEKRRMLADMARVDAAALMDDDGALDLEKVRALPPWCIQEVSITENGRTDKEGRTTTTRQVRVKLVDRLHVLKLDAELEEEQRGGGPGDGEGEEPADGAGPTERAREVLRRIMNYEL